MPAAMVLLRAYVYARTLQRDPWDFAVEIQELLNAGVGISEVRWLVYTGVAEHGREVTLSDDLHRTFQKGGRLALNRKTCLVLSDLGAPLLTQLEEAATGSSPLNGKFVETRPQIHQPGGTTAATFEAPQKPTWDCDRHELRWGNVLVKQFKLASPNQETVLAVFAEEDWPPRIDDPLPPSPTIDSKRRLNDTIKSLNRHQRKRLIRFLGDGTGQGVRWEPMNGQHSS
jgi:hypothetical protein